MTPIKKRKFPKPNKRSTPTSKTESLTLEDLVVDGSLPRVKVKVSPLRSKSRSKPNERLVIELQCEV